MTALVKILLSRVMSRRAKSDATPAYQRLQFFCMGPGMNIGDRLFLLNTFLLLSDMKLPIRLLGDYEITVELYKNILPNARFEYFDTQQEFTIVCTQNNYISLNKSQRKKCLVLRSDRSTEFCLAGKFCKDLTGRNFQNYNTIKCLPRMPLPSSIGASLEEKLIICAPFTESGFFRRSKKKDAIIRKKCLELKESQKSTIVLVGKHNDRWRYDRVDKFWDLDARGKTKVDELCQLMNGDISLDVVCYDNGVLLLANIFERRCYFVARGRWSKKDRDFHKRAVFPMFRDDLSGLNQIG